MKAASLPPPPPAALDGVCVRGLPSPKSPTGCRVPGQGLGGKRRASGNTVHSLPPRAPTRAELGAPGRRPPAPGTALSTVRGARAWFLLQPDAPHRPCPAPSCSPGLLGTWGPLVGGRLLGDVTVTGWQPAEPSGGTAPGPWPLGPRSPARTSVPAGCASCRRSGQGDQTAAPAGGSPPRGRGRARFPRSPARHQPGSVQ